MTDPDDAVAARAPAPQPEVLDSAPEGGRRHPALLNVSAHLSWLRQRVEAVPLRARLVAIVAALLVAALTVSGSIVVTLFSRILMNRVDDDLHHAIIPMTHAVTDAKEHNTNSFRPGPFPSNTVAYAVWLDGSASGVLRPSNSNLPDADPAFPTGEDLAGLGHPFTVGSTSGTVQWRVLALGLQQTGTNEPLGLMFIATPLTGVETTLNNLRDALFSVAAAVVVVGAWLGWFAVRRSFRPLIEVEETAAAIAAGDLSRRIPERPPTTEVGSLTRSLNAMLTQIESAFRAQEASEARTRRFAADASHELRTPLVSIRGFAELYRQGAVPPDEVPRTMKRIEDEAKRMGSLVEDLLLLARLDAQRPGRHDPVDLMVLGGDAVHDARGLDAQRDVTLVGLDGHGPRQAVVTGDEDRLRQVVANLLANAVRHTPAGTPIEVAVGIRGDHAVLEVRDHGQGLTPEQAQKAFERFYRVDSSRQRNAGGGSGLGLSIVSAVVASHAGQVEVVPTPGGGATFRVRLPARPAAPDGAEPDDVVPTQGPRPAPRQDPEKATTHR